MRRDKILTVSTFKIESEYDLAREIVKIANDAKELGYKLEEEKRLLTKDEA